MNEYIYDIIRVLSEFDFSVWNYAKDNGLQVNNAAQQYYCKKLKKDNISDNEVKEITRFIYYKYEDKCKSCLGSKIFQLSEGTQILEVELEDVQLRISVDIQCNSIEISLESPFKATVSISDDNPNESFLIQTVTGNVANELTKGKITRGISTLLLRKTKK